MWWYRLGRRDVLWYVPHLSRRAPFVKTQHYSYLFCSLVSGTTCTEINAYYSQCLPGAAASPPPASPTVSSGSSATGTSSAPTGLSSIPASTLTQFSNFGTNPNNVAMFVYKPKKVAANPPLIVASHCEYY